MTARVQIEIEAHDAASGVFRAVSSELGVFGSALSDVDTLLAAQNKTALLSAKAIEAVGKAESFADKTTKEYAAAAKEADAAVGNLAKAEDEQAAAAARTAQALATLAITGLKAVVDFTKESIDVTMQYAGEVRDLSLASGQSAEASSRMLQVLDDYQLSADDAATATRALTKQGLAPTIETVAQLSGQYLQLNDAQAKNEFLMKNLGRAGKEWMNLLAQGPDAIMAMNDAVSEGLILTEENIQASEDYRLALDQFNDGVMALKVSIGNELLPTLTAMMDGLNNSNEIRAEANRLMMEGVAHNREEAMAMAAATVAAEENAVAKADLAAATETAAQQEAALAEAAKITSDENKSFIGVLGSVTNATETYRQGLAENNQALADGKISLEEHGAKVSALASDYETSKNRIVLSIIEMKLAQDGWTDAELDSYLRAGQAMGVFTQGMVTDTKRMIKIAEDTIAPVEHMGDQIYHTGKRAVDASADLGIMADGAAAFEEKIRPAAAAVGGLKSQLNGLPVSGSAWSYDFVINVSGQVPRIATATYSTAGGYNTNVHPGEDSGRQQGGEVFAGQPTWIGEAGREKFVPAQNGRILGHAESLHAATVGGMGMSGNNYFYGPVTISPDSGAGGDVMSIR